MSNPLATSVNCGTFSLNSTEIADFAAGFVAGFTGDDYQTYFESCLQDTADFETQMCNAVNDFATKNNQKMVEGVHIVLTQIPVLAGFLNACPNASADVQTVENWGSYWMSQGSLKVYSTAYRNLVGNISTVTADVSLLTDDFDAGNFYGTAMEAAALAKLALPVPSAEDLEMVGDKDCGDFTINTTVLADYLAGFFNGFTGNDDKAAMETCFHDNDSFETDVCDFVADFRTKENQKVLEGLQKVLGDLPELDSFMSSCPANVQADKAVISDWFKYWKQQGSLKVYQTLYKNIVGNMPTIKQYADDIKTKYDAKDYYGVAVDASSIAKIGLPVNGAENLTGTECADFTLTNAILADYISGFMDGITGHSTQTEVDACFQDNEQFESDVCTFVADFRTKDNQKVIQGLSVLLHDLPTLKSFMDTCPADVLADRDVIGGWYSYWRNQGEMKVYQNAYKNVLSNFDEIKSIANGIADKYDAHDYYGAAVAASSIAKIALPLPAYGDDEDTCSTLGDGDCQANSICSWCTAGAVPSACHSMENAKHLPAGVFICSGVSSEFLQ